MSITIRPALPEDNVILATLNRFVHELHVATRPDHFKPTRIQELADWYGSLLNQPTARIWIAESDGLAIGYVLAFFHERAENAFCVARRWCEVDQIAIDPNHRRSGIARALVGKVLEEARLRGISHVEVVSWSFNDDAHLAFRKLGFTPKVVRFELNVDPEQ